MISDGILLIGLGGMMVVILIVVIKVKGMLIVMKYIFDGFVYIVMYVDFLCLLCKVFEEVSLVNIKSFVE